MQRVLARAFLVSFAVGLFAFVTYAAYWYVAPREGWLMALAVWPGLPLAALVFVPTLLWAIEASDAPAERSE